MLGAFKQRTTGDAAEAALRSSTRSTPISSFASARPESRRTRSSGPDAPRTRSLWSSDGSHAEEQARLTAPCFPRNTERRGPSRCSTPGAWTTQRSRQRRHMPGSSAAARPRRRLMALGCGLVAQFQGQLARLAVVSRGFRAAPRGRSNGGASAGAGVRRPSSRPGGRRRRCEGGRDRSRERAAPGISRSHDLMLGRAWAAAAEGALTDARQSALWRRPRTRAGRSFAVKAATSSYDLVIHEARCG